MSNQSNEVGSGKDEKQTPNKQGDPKKENESAPIATAVLTQTAPSPAACQDPNDQEKPFIERWKPWIEVFGIFAGLFLVYITYRQWGDMRRQLTLDERAWVGLAVVHLNTPYSADNI